MTLPLVMYGATDCDDTEHTRLRLDALGILYREVNIDHDTEAEHFVIFINGGYRSTPTLVFGEGKFRLVITEPTDGELRDILTRSGYSVTGSSNT